MYPTLHSCRKFSSSITVQLLLAVAALENLDIQSVDVKTAYLYGDLDEEIYMEQPEGFKLSGKENKVW